MRLSAREEHGLRVMVELAHRYAQGPIPLAQVARAQRLPLSYLEQIMPLLRAAGLLRSTRGAYGGYSLARDPSTITVGDVIRALEGSLISVTCIAKSNDQTCDLEQRCLVKGVWQRVHENIARTLDSITLADLCHPQEASEER